MTHLFALVTLVVPLLAAGGQLLAVEVNPETPPGFGGIQQLLDWMGGAMPYIAVGAVLVVAGKVMWNKKHDEPGAELGRLGWVAVGIGLAAAAGTVATQLAA